MKRKSFYTPLVLLPAVDQVTKHIWAEADFVMIPHILAVQGTKNTGMAFGWLSGNSLLLALFTVPVLCALFFFLSRHNCSRMEMLGMGLLIGGALGNLTDRLVLGYVVDMFKLLFMPLFVFNVADVGITLGAAILIACLIFGKDETKDGAA